MLFGNIGLLTPLCSNKPSGNLLCKRSNLMILMDQYDMTNMMILLRSTLYYKSFTMLNLIKFSKAAAHAKYK